MYRTTAKSHLTVPLGFLPDLLQKRPLSTLLEEYVEDHERYGKVLKIGPIPEGAPIGLISNIRVLSEDRSLGARAAHAKKLAHALIKIIKALKSLDQNASSEEAREAFADVVDDLIGLSACPDYVINRGHYFGTDRLPASEGEPGLSANDKWALIEFLKTF